jgi:hypothetical protein
MSEAVRFHSLSEHLDVVKPGIDCARLSRAAVRARQTRSFIYALIAVFVSSIEVRLLIDAVPPPQDRLS